MNLKKINQWEYAIRSYLLPRRHKRRAKKGFRQARKLHKELLDGTANAGDNVLFEKLNKIPNKYLKTLTRDNGKENMNYKNIEDTLNLKVYFAHPYHSWERGSNKNCNGLFRRFFPKWTDFSNVTDEQIQFVEDWINNRPMACLNYKTPNEVYNYELKKISK